MPVSNQNMGYDPREMLATFYQQQNEALGNYYNPSYAMQRGGPMGFDVLPPQPGQTRPPMPMPSPGVSPLPPPAVNGPPMMPPPMAGMQPLPFGGFRANGGPVQPGRAYVVGERGPELMVPQVPGTIVPNAATPMRADNDRNVRPMTDFNPVTGQASSFDGMSRTAFFGKAMQADPSKRAALGDGSGVYGDIQRGAVGLAPQTDARSFGAGGMNFVGPPAMPNPKPSPAPPALPAGPATGMLVAGPGGSVKWQRGTGPGTTLPPQTTPAAPALSASMPMMMPANNSRIAQSPSNRPYAELAGGTGSLANRGTRPVGRSANDPQRIAEQMRRRGDPSAILRFGAQQMGQDFARERDAVNFAQQQQMFGQQQQAMDARDAANYNQGLTMFEMQQRAKQARDAQNFEQQQQLEAGRRSADLAAQEQARQYGLKPVPVTGTATPYFQDAQGRIYAGSQPERAPEPVPQGLVPRGYQGGQTIYGPKDAPNFTIREIPGEPIQDPVTGKWTTKPGQMARIFEDGTYEPIQPRGQAAGPAPSPPPADAAARLAELRRKAGL